MTSDKRRAPRKSPAARTARLPSAPVQLELDDARLRQLWRRVNEEAARHDQRAAEDAHDLGSLLNEITSLSVTLKPEDVAGEFLLGPESARECMAIAESTTRLMAGFYGLDRLRLGLVLLPHFKLRRLEQLEAVDLPVHYPDGSAVRFPATRDWLERAVDAIEGASPAV